MLLHHCGFISHFFANDKFVKLFCNLEDDFKIDSDETDLGRSLRSTPIMMLPPYFAPTEIVEMTCTKRAAYSWDSGISSNAANNLKFLGTLFKRAFYLSFDQAVRNYRIFERLIDDFTYAKNSPIGMFDQIREHLATKKDDDHVVTDVFWMCSEEASSLDSRVKGAAVLTLLLGLTEQMEEERDIIHTLFGIKFDSDTDSFVNDIGNLPSLEIRQGGTTMPAIYSALVSTADVIDVSREKEWVQNHLDTTLASTKAPKAQKSNFALMQTKLTPESVALVNRLINERRISLAQRVGGWLREFSTPPIQTAIALLLDAKFDAFFKAPIEYGEDRAGLFGEYSDQIDSVIKDSQQQGEDGLLAYNLSDDVGEE